MSDTTSRIRIVLGSNFLARYPEGGGHWMWFLQYPVGLQALGHDVFLLEQYRSTGHKTCDEEHIKAFFERLGFYGLQDRCALILCNPEEMHPTLDSTPVLGMNRERFKEIAGSADLIWNLGSSLPPSLTSIFKKRVLIDVDPGQTQVTTLFLKQDYSEYDALLTVGLNIGHNSCLVPTLNRKWKVFRPFVYLPFWGALSDPGPSAPFGSITQWNWEQLTLDDKILSISKREAYLRYLELPKRAGRPFSLAANIDINDYAGDRSILLQNGWRVENPHQVAGSPNAYKQYIAGLRSEVCCVKPIYRELRTGWFSDRSACFLASGRPVLFEDTGINEHLPVGKGLLVFHNLDEAVANVKEIDADYTCHSQAARVLAEEYFDSDHCLTSMLAASE